MFVVKNIPAIFSNCVNVTRALGVVEREKYFLLLSPGLSPLTSDPSIVILKDAAARSLKSSICQ